MEQKQKGRSHKATAPMPNVRKGKYFVTPLQEIRKLFLTGLHFCAKQLNAWTGSKDSRKCISTLRKQGMNIKDLWYNKEFPTAPHIKIYWLETDTTNRSQSLFVSVDDKLSINGKMFGCCRLFCRLTTICINL